MVGSPGAKWHPSRRGGGKAVGVLVYVCIFQCAGNDSLFGRRPLQFAPEECLGEEP